LHITAEEVPREMAQPLECVCLGKSLCRFLPFLSSYPHKNQKTEDQIELDSSIYYAHNKQTTYIYPTDLDPEQNWDGHSPKEHLLWENPPAISPQLA
jgi:hypothetical protein